MAIEDYVPNIFGGVPVGYEGLLGADQSAALQKRSNLAGLLGFGAALAQGMGAGGARRSALQNVLTAAAQGFSGAGQTYEAGINQLLNRQKIAQSQYQLQAIEQLLQDPRVKDDPTMQAYIRANPAEAIKFLAENAPIQQALAAPTAPPPVSVAPAAAAMATPSGAAPSGATPQDGQLPPVTVEGRPSPDSAMLTRKNQLLEQNQRLTALPSKRADEIIKRNQGEIETINKELDRSAVAGFDFQAVENIVPQQFKGRVANLRQAAESGAITMNELTQRLQDIEKGATEFVLKKTDYTNQDRRVAAGLFQGRAIEELNPAELMQLENKLYEMRIAERKAGATNINMPTESERTAGFLTNRVVNSLNQLQTVVGAKPTAASPNFGAEAVRFLTGSEYLKNLANPEARQQVEAAQLEILDAALTLGTGAAYTREQLENYRRSYFPQLGDKPGTVADKQKRLTSLIDSAMIKSGRAAPSMPAGVAPAFDINAIQQELDRRKGK
jgi:hypothetical protein